MLQFNFHTNSNCVFDLKSIIKGKYTQKQLAKKLNMSCRQLQNIMYNQQLLVDPRLEQILQLCGYKLELTIAKI